MEWYAKIYGCMKAMRIWGTEKNAEYGLIKDNLRQDNGWE
jgi:hypothetical protein